jgi:peroxiredoxin
MHALLRKWGVVFGALLLIVCFWPSSKTLAVLSSCTANSTPNQVSPGLYSSISFTVQDTDNSTTIQWVQITIPPDDNIAISNVSGIGWAYSYNSNQVIFTNGDIYPDSSQGFTLNIKADNTTTSGDNWTVMASDDLGGANAIACTGNGNLALNILAPTIISNIQISSITSSSVTISWNTNNPTEGNIDYGLTGNYGSETPMGSSFVTSHQQTISGLSTNTGYHFTIYGIDQNSNTVYSSDNTFLTAEPPTNNNPTNNNPTNNNGSSTNTSTNNSTSTNTSTTTPHSTIARKKNSTTNTVPPQITLSTKLSGAYTIVPTFSGTASDNVGVTKVDYSTDGGQNWLPVDVLSTAGQTSVTFSFTPLLPLDGNYVIVARATDASGNTTTTASQTFILDRLPPLVGGNIVSVGPQILQPSSNGTIQAQAGVNERITLSAAGAPTSIVLVAATTVNTKSGPKVYSQSFNLTASQDSGLWSGVMGFTRPGNYTLTVNAVDGAGSTSSRTLTSVYVSKPGQTLSSVTNKPIASTVTAYYFEPESQTWGIWDATAYGQQNPQKTDKSGSFSFFLPAGKYYLQATSAGYRKLVSSIFTINLSSPISSDLKLMPLHGLSFGSHYLVLPSFSVQYINLSATSPKNVSQGSLVGQPAPNFSLTDTDGATIRPIDLLGRPTLISFNSTWAPTTDEELSVLSQLQSDPNFNIIPVALQQSSGIVQSYTSTANLNLNWLLDPDSVLSTSYDVQSLPMNYFIDRNGIIRQVVVGVMTRQQILNSLTGI